MRDSCDKDLALKLYPLPLGDAEEGLDDFGSEAVEEPDLLVAPAHPVIERIRSGSVCVIGCDPRALDVSRHAIRTRDMLLWMKELLNSDDDPELLIADLPLRYNIEDGLKREGVEIINQESVNERARLIGERDRLFLEAVQDYLIENDFVPEERRKKIHLMSEVLDNDPNFQMLLKRLEQLCALDDDFKEKVLKCIPKRIRESMGDDLNPRYVLFQLAATIYHRGKKIGHKGEKTYDRLARQSLEAGYIELPEDDRPTFAYPKVQGVTGNVFYRWQDVPLDGEAANFKKVDGLSFFKGKKPDDREAFWKGIKELASETIPIYEGFLRKLKTTERLSKEKRESTWEAEAWKVVYEILAEFFMFPRFRELMYASGIMEVIDRDLNPRLIHRYNYLPFNIQPDARDKGSDLAYFLRFLCGLFTGMNGPISMSSMNRSVQGNYLWEIWYALYTEITGQELREYLRNTWDFEGWYNLSHSPFDIYETNRWPDAAVWDEELRMEKMNTYSTEWIVESVGTADPIERWSRKPKVQREPFLEALYRAGYNLSSEHEARARASLAAAEIEADSQYWESEIVSRPEDGPSLVHGGVMVRSFHDEDRGATVTQAVETAELIAASLSSDC
ncbi:hypothetical protein HOG48_05120 [Candidatus Peregrinibacteria bacterium]|jgi:hypothetical protein|nr:hypothetical protein [Candidatus Peregrinibacteria bacterium]